MSVSISTIRKFPILHEARTLISAGLFDRVFLHHRLRREELLADNEDLGKVEFAPLATARTYSKGQLLRSLVIASNIQEADHAVQMFRSQEIGRLPFLHLENNEPPDDLVNIVSHASSIADRYVIADPRLGFRRVGKHHAHDVSIIVPVYGVAAYIERCASSLKNQTFGGRSEILFIDDGSTDGSAEIIRRVIDRADHMKMISKPNGGAASARNVGLDLAQGEFVGFVDGDDHVSEDFIDSLYRAAIVNDCDIAQGEFFYVNAQDGTMKKHPEWFSVQLGDLGVISTPSYPMMLQTPAIWRRLYSRHLLQSNAIRFNENFRRHDDLPFNIEVLTKSQQIAIVRRPVYYYLLGRDGQDVGTGRAPVHSFQAVRIHAQSHRTTILGTRLLPQIYDYHVCSPSMGLRAGRAAIEGTISEWDGHPDALHAGTHRRAWQIAIRSSRISERIEASCCGVRSSHFAVAVT